jgi:predicted transcriptional regulator
MRKEIILEVIKKIPGISYNEIVRETKLSNGVISHYIIKLLENKEIEKEGETRAKYFTRNIQKKDRVLITLLRNKTNNEIFRYLIKNSELKEDVTANQISKKVKKSGSTISVSLKILQKNNIVERVIMNKNAKLTNDIGYRISNKDVWTAFFMKYNL